MHKATILKVAVITGLLALAVNAYAANTITLIAITLINPAILNGKQLEAGQYEVKVSSNGDVIFLRGKTEVVTAKAKLEDSGTKARYNAVTKASDGCIIKIQFEGKKQVLVFDNTAKEASVDIWR